MRLALVLHARDPGAIPGSGIYFPPMVNWLSHFPVEEEYSDRNRVGGLLEELAMLACQADC